MKESPQERMYKKVMQKLNIDQIKSDDYLDMNTLLPDEIKMNVVNFYKNRYSSSIDINKKNDIELFVQKYFGLKSNVKEDYEIVTDFGIIVNLLAMFNDKK